MKGPKDLGLGIRIMYRFFGLIFIVNFVGTNPNYMNFFFDEKLHESFLLLLLLLFFIIIYFNFVQSRMRNYDLGLSFWLLLYLSVIFFLCFLREREREKERERERESRKEKQQRRYVP